MTKGHGLAFEPEYGFGYGAAIVCALIWSAYSVLNRRYGAVPVEAVCGFCSGAAARGFATHWGAENWVSPDAPQWFAIIGLGLGPVGAAFFAWDYGTKHGNIQILGAVSYGAPLFSTVLLIVFGKAEATPTVIVGCLMIVAGALVASREMVLRSRRKA